MTIKHFINVLLAAVVLRHLFYNFQNSFNQHVVHTPYVSDGSLVCELGHCPLLLK